MADVPFTEAEKEYFENGNIDVVMLYKEIKTLNAKVDTINNKVTDSAKTDEQIRDEVMSIKDSKQRLKAINENMDVFDRLKRKARASRDEEEHRRLGGNR